MLILITLIVGLFVGYLMSLRKNKVPTAIYISTAFIGAIVGAFLSFGDSTLFLKYPALFNIWTIPVVFSVAFSFVVMIADRGGIKKTIIPVLVVIAIIFGMVFFDSIDKGSQTETVSNEVSVEIQEYFNEQLRVGVVDRIGQPIHGFVPFMFLQAFTGIVPKDFDGANALSGEYTIVEKELIFIMDEGVPVNSAAEMLTEKGMETLFTNIRKRANVSISTTDEIDGLMLFLGAPTGLAVTECLQEQRNVDACIEIYKPVCGKVNVQCITTPCNPIEETFPNSCNACKNSLVDTYKEGECVIE